MSEVLLFPALLGAGISLFVFVRATKWWPTRLKALLLWPLYLLIVIFLYFSSSFPWDEKLVQFESSFTNAVTFFTGEDPWGQVWLCSLVTNFTLGFTRTRLGSLKNLQHILDLAVYGGIVIIFLWKMGIIVF